jgi:hypothetical protein
MATTWINRGHFYVPHVTPVIVDCNFVVAAADAGGLGITNLKGQGVQNVFMHTSQTPGRGSNGYLNPNPAAGYIAVQLADNFSRLYQLFSSFSPPLSGSNLNVDAGSAALTAGVMYVITAVGTSTAADWLALGVPAGVAPAVGVAFIALVTGAGAGNGTVQLAKAGLSVATDIEVIGTPSTSLHPVPVAGSPHVGGWLNLAAVGPTNSSTTTLIPVAPADGTVIRLAMYLSQSSVVVAGE